ncbi:MAG: hypothetical protein FJZ87_00680 [Chloroflexi bacterium]|nr:hypothetical protein [Chloroflexota bacterium]
MQRVAALILCGLILSSCSFDPSGYFPEPLVQESPTIQIPPTFVPTPVPSFTPTVATPTFTLTPTLVGFKSATPSPDYSPTLPPTPVTPGTSTPTVDLQGFIAAFTAGDVFYKAGACEPISMKFTAQASNASGTAFVVLFVRFKSKQSGTTSKWTDITMENRGAGTFNHELTAEEMIAVSLFTNAWVEYQFVATDSKNREIGRTAIFRERLTLSDCAFTATPSVTTTPVPTP